MAKGKVTFDVERCKSCGLCVEACPKEILAIDTDYINQKGYNPAKVIDEEKKLHTNWDNYASIYSSFFQF
mgnify:FL=1